MNGGDNPCGPDTDVSNLDAIHAGQSAGYWLGDVVGGAWTLFGDILDKFNPMN